jgi:hypothetical protein
VVEFTTGSRGEVPGEETCGKKMMIIMINASGTVTRKVGDYLHKVCGYTAEAPSSLRSSLRSYRDSQSGRPATVHSVRLTSAPNSSDFVQASYSFACATRGKAGIHQPIKLHAAAFVPLFHAHTATAHTKAKCYFTPGVSKLLDMRATYDADLQVASYRTQILRFYIIQNLTNYSKEVA